MRDVSYAPGRLIAVADERCVALVEATPDSAAATWIWQRVASGTSAETLLAGLLGAGFDGVGGFALLAGHAAGPRRLFCRGQVAAVVEGGAAPGRIDGAGLLTWREYAVAADAERIVLGERPDDDGAFLLPATAGVLLACCVIVGPARAGARDTSHYDLAAGGYAMADTITIGGRASVPAAAPPQVPQQTREATRPADDGLLGEATRPPHPPPARIDPARAEQAARSAPPDLISPAVPALLCPTGHVNPPSEAACRRCGAPLPNDTLIVPRPVLGVLRLSTGDVITLDRDVVMGRNPRADFTGTDGEDRPHVVKLPSADGDISRTHLRVTLDGWHVLVTDLNSTNGSLVTLPGRDPERLRRGETVPIKPGTVVTLTDGIDFRYEVYE
jgi:hypothetical protein